MLENGSLNLSQQLLILRRHRGFTQVQLASLSGISRVTISHIEQSRNVSHVTIETLVRLAQALGVTTDTLLGRFDQSSTSPLPMAHSACSGPLHPEEESTSVTEALRTHAVYYSTLLAQTNIMIYIYNMSSELVAFNQTYASFFGYSHEELSGKHSWELITASSRDISFQMRAQKMEGVPITSYRVVALTKNQQSIPVDVTTQLIYRCSQPIGIQGIARCPRT